MSRYDNYPPGMSRSDLIHVGELAPKLGIDFDYYCEICGEPICFWQIKVSVEDGFAHNECYKEENKNDE